MPNHTFPIGKLHPGKKYLGKRRKKTRKEEERKAKKGRSKKHGKQNSYRYHVKIIERERETYIVYYQSFIMVNRSYFQRTKN